MVCQDEYISVKRQATWDRQADADPRAGDGAGSLHHGRLHTEHNAHEYVSEGQTAKEK